MRWAVWRRRRQGVDLPQPQWLAGSFATGLAAEGVYLATTIRGRRFHRVTAHGLGGGGPVDVVADDEGLLIIRLGGRGWRIRDADVLGVRRGWRGRAVISWRLGGVELDTHIRPDDDPEASPMEATVERVLRRTARA